MKAQGGDSGGDLGLLEREGSYALWSPHKWRGWTGKMGTETEVAPLLLCHGANAGFQYQLAYQLGCLGECHQPGPWQVAGTELLGPPAALLPLG